jgi:hypothetical protein
VVLTSFLFYQQNKKKVTLKKQSTVESIFFSKCYRTRKTLAACGAGASESVAGPGTSLIADFSDFATR